MYKKLSRSQFLRWGLLTSILLIQPPKNNKKTNFSFEVVKIDQQGKIIKRSVKQALSQTYSLNGDVKIEFVYIPAGELLEIATPGKISR